VTRPVSSQSWYRGSKIQPFDAGRGDATLDRILENNAFGLVATSSISKERPDWNWQWKPGDPHAVGAASVVINKETGEFWWGWMFAGGGRVPNEMTHGTCRKN
jgi:hypothetical protein